MVSCSYGEAQATRVTVIPDRQSRDVTGSGFELPLWMRLGEVSVAFMAVDTLSKIMALKIVGSFLTPRGGRD